MSRSDCHRLVRALLVLGVLAARDAMAQNRLVFDTAAPPISYSPNAGLQLRAEDGRVFLRFRAWLQADYRGTLGEDAATNSTTASIPSGFTLRRSRVIVDAQVAPGIAVRLSPDFGGTRVQLEDAFVDFGLSRSLWLRAGRQRVPFGVERERFITEIPTPERSLVSQLTPNRDVGVVATGDLPGGRLSVTVGVQNGVPDGQSGGTDVNDGKDLIGRLSVMPRLRSRAGVAQGVRLVIGGTVGTQAGAVGDPQLPTYSTSSGQPFFRYAAATELAPTVAAEGSRRRLGAAVVVHEGRAGVLAEAIEVRQRVQRGSGAATIAQRGWLAMGLWSLTGEPSGVGGLTPARPFAPRRGQWGAVQLVGRVSRLSIGTEAFPTFADADVSARRATAWAIGANWFWTRQSKLQWSYEETRFQGGAAAGTNRPTDRTLWLRTQLFY